MIAIILLGTFGGIKLDELFPNEYSAFTIILSLVAVGISMYFVVRQVTDFSKKQEKDNE